MLNFEYATRSTLFLARDGEDEYWVKVALIDYKIHPDFFKHPGLWGGFDIAIASFDISKSTSFISNLEAFKKMLLKITPKLGSNSIIQNEEELFFTGYPGERGGSWYQFKGKIFDWIYIEGGLTTLLVFKSLFASGGMAGCPIFRINESKTELVGFYVGYDESWSMHYWSSIATPPSSITKCIPKDEEKCVNDTSYSSWRWINNLMLDRLIIEDLETKILPGKKYKPRKQLKFEIKGKQKEDNRDQFELKEIDIDHILETEYEIIDIN